MPVLMVGDLMFTRGRSFMSRLIRYFSRRVGEPRSIVNHVGVVTTGGEIDGSPARAWVTEAGVTVTTNHVLPRDSEVAVFRNMRLSSAQRMVIANTALKYRGMKYGYWKIAAHLLDWFLQGAYVFRRLAGMKNYPICSWLAAYSYSRVVDRSFGFGVPPGAASPDDMWDWVKSHPEEWVQVYSDIR